MKTKFLPLLLLMSFFALTVNAQITSNYSLSMTLGGTNPDVKAVKTLTIKGKETAIIVGSDLHNAATYPNGATIQFNNIIGITADDVDYLASGISHNLYDVTSDGDDIYVVGDMPSISVYTGGTWTQVPINTDTFIRKIEYVGDNVSGGKIFLVGGPMHTINGVTVGNLAAITIQGGLVTSVVPYFLPNTNIGMSMSSTADKVYISCHNPGGQIMFLFNKTALTLGTMPQPPTYTLFLCEAHDSIVYAFGEEANFTSGLWKFDGSNWSMIATFPAASGSALKFYDGALYASGWFDGEKNVNYSESKNSFDSNSGAPALRGMAVLNGNLIGVTDGGNIFTTKNLFSGVVETTKTPSKIYPVPAHNMLSVMTEKTQLFSLSDINGRVILTGNTNNTIDVTEIPSGMYFVTVNGTAQKVVIQH
jgi:hypothetical protein